MYNKLAAIAARLAVHILKESIRNCSGAIADISGLSANVMYELGFAHGENKKVIIIYEMGNEENKKELPFDIKTEYTIFYSSNNLTQLKKKLKGKIKVIFIKD